MPELTISRRVFIGSSLFIVSAPLLSMIPSDENELQKVRKDGQFFNKQQLTMLVDIAEIMIPKSETPGATDAQVAPVLDGLMLTWAGKTAKSQFTNCLIQVESISQDTYKQNYTSLALHERQTIITELDKRAFKNKNTALSTNYRRLKEIIFHIYYSSEEANPNYMLLPGAYRGCMTEEEVAQANARGRV